VPDGAGPDLVARHEDVAGEHGRLDLMFNNAGIGVGGREVDELTAAHWRRIANPYVRRAAVAAICEPRLLTDPGGRVGGRVVDVGDPPVRRAERGSGSPPRRAGRGSGSPR